MLDISIVLIGYSILAAVHLMIGHFTSRFYHEFSFERSMGILLLCVLVAIQVIHFTYLQHHYSLLSHTVYIELLYSVAPAFYLFSKPLLFAQSNHRITWWLHFSPLLLAPFLPNNLAVPLAFALGAGYLLWLAYGVYALRHQRDRFTTELWLLGTIFLIASAASVAGLGVFSIPISQFILMYSSAIGSAFLLVSIVLLHNPRLSSEVAEAARETYAVSTLLNIDCDDTLQQLDRLMSDKALYQLPELDLARLAQKLGLSSHQLSELINTRLGKGFSRYLREYRVEEAKKMLLASPSISVLAISLTVGFNSQSNFYSAFREITGTTPGRFRELNASE